MYAEMLLGLVLLLILFLFNRKPGNLPPGIWGLPFIGSFPRKDIHMVDQARQHSKKFGDIFTWRIGSRIYIFLCSYSKIKAALKKLEFSGRAKLYSSAVATNFVNAGVVNATGKLWHDNRRFGLFHLKNLGLGKSSYETVIHDEVMCLLKDFESCVDKKPGPIAYSLNVAILNVIWRICADRRYDVSDKDFQYFVKLLDGLITDVPSILVVYDNFPWLYKIVPGFLNKWFGIEDFTDIYRHIGKFLQGIVQEHKETLDPENPRDFIDQYLIENDKRNNTIDTATTSDTDLVKFVFDLFAAGSETTSSTIRWAIFYLAKHQDVQKKMQEELDSVVDRNTLPSMKDRDRLPYLDAVLHEVQRIISLVPMSLPHAAIEDTTFDGYSIPKDAILMPCLNLCHTDPLLWKKPEEFYPENFLDDEGKIIKGKEGYVPFSIGKRVCLGESLAVMELFLFMSAIFQKFSFTLPEGEDLDPKKSPKNRIINACKPYKVIIRNRC